MSEKNIEAVIVKDLSNIYYLSGFTGTTAVLLITAGRQYLLTDFRYLQQAEKEAQDYEIVRVDSNGNDKIAELLQGIRTVGIEEEQTPLADFRKIQAALPDCELLDASGIFAELRQVKDASEIDRLREVIQITDEAFREILNQIKPGAVEQEISLDLEFSLRKRGASGRSFDYIVASGQRGALPHGVASTKRMAAGEMVTLDFGAKMHQYCSDLTRTVCLGKPDPKQIEIYNLVLEAQQRAIDGLKPGMTGKEGDALAREVITRAGYGDYFGHGLGHSVGLDIHENPRLSPKEDRTIEPGMVITVEPGIYIPEWGGVRIEDVVLVTNFGVEVLTQSPKYFIIID
jgi:Xaa-Pro aminopeptidase